MSISAGPNNSVMAPVNTVNVNGLVIDQLALYYDTGRTYSYAGTGSTWTDLSSNARNATMYNQGGSTYSINPPGPPTFSTNNGGIFSFNGTTNWGKFADFTAGSAVTLSVWIQTTGGGGLLSHCSGGPVGLSYMISGGKMYYMYYTSSWQSVTGATTVNDGKWKHCVWAKSGTNMITYINGVQDSVFTLTGDVSASICCIGSSWGPCNSDSYGPGTDSYGSVFSGNIGVLMVHNKQLSSTEVTKNFTNQRFRFGI